jgi:DNA polymerase III epsilon subunit family exonuclease
MLQLLREIPIAVVDTETTGASAAFGHKIIEIGIVRIENGREVARYEQLIDPRRRITAGVTAFTGITQAMVYGQPRFGDQLDVLIGMLSGAAILGHNIRFDLSFLQAEFRRAKVDIKECLGAVPVLDTVRIARRRFGRGGNALPLLSRKLGVDPVRSHRALADAITTAAVFEKLLEPIGGFECSLCDCLEHQGGAMDLARPAAARVLPLELEEALEANRPVSLEYIDGFGNRTERVVQPLHVRRRMGRLMLIAHCALRNDQRTFKLDRVVRMVQMDMPPLVIPPRVKKRGGARIYDDVGAECPPQQGGAAIYDAPQQAELFPLGEQIYIEARAARPRPYLTITSNPS